MTSGMGEETSPGGLDLLYVVAYLAPWGVLSAFLPGAHRAAAFSLLVVLALLLLAAGAWARARAASRGLDGAAWGFAAIVSLGLAMLALLAWQPRAGETLPSFLCHDCGRLGAMHEPFCFGCGAHA